MAEACSPASCLPLAALVVGCSDKGCDVNLPVQGVAARHARLERFGGVWYVRDLGSGAGVRVRCQQGALACPLWLGDTVVYEPSALPAVTARSPAPRSMLQAPQAPLTFHRLDSHSPSAGGMGGSVSMSPLTSTASVAPPATAAAIHMQLETAAEPLTVWPRLAVTVHNVALGRREYRELPCMLGVCDKRSLVGRHRTRSLVPLPDIKSKKKHAVLHVDLDLPGDARRRLPAGSLRVVPYKGKPVFWLLGRHDCRHRRAWRLGAGDVFAVGLSLMRVLYVGVRPAGARAAAYGRGECTTSVLTIDGGRLEVGADDGTKFQRAQAKADKRSAKLASQEAAEATERAAGKAAASCGRQHCGCSASVGEVAKDAGSSSDTSGGVSGANASVGGSGSDSESDSDSGSVDDEGEGEEEDGLDDDSIGLGRTKWNPFERRRLVDEPEVSQQYAGPFVHLVCICGPYRTREHRVHAPGATLGSDAACDVSMPIDESASPLHAHLTYHDDGWFLADHASANGTFLLVEDGGRAAAVGDVYRIARTELQVLAVPDRYA